jgi:hypothetical protein
MLQINPFLDCTLYSGIVVHIGRNNHQIMTRLLILVNFFSAANYTTIIYTSGKNTALQLFDVYGKFLKEINDDIDSQAQVDL